MDRIDKMENSFKETKSQQECGRSREGSDIPRENRSVDLLLVHQSEISSSVKQLTAGLASVLDILARSSGEDDSFTLKASESLDGIHQCLGKLHESNQSIADIRTFVEILNENVRALNRKDSSYDTDHAAFKKRKEEILLLESKLLEIGLDEELTETEIACLDLRLLETEIRETEDFLQNETSKYFLVNKH